MQNAQSILLKTIEALIEEGQLDKAVETLLQLDEQAQAGLRIDIVHQSGSLAELERDNRNGIISYDEYRRYRAKIRLALLELMKEVPGRLQTNAQIQGLSTFAFQVPDEPNLEKIIGKGNNLLRINWLEKALRASKAVCRVVCESGELGTGFLTKDGFIFTNNHVLPDAATAKTARIEFNYEMGADGAVKSRVSYNLDASSYVTSPVSEFDFARVKVVDNPKTPLSQWGFVEFDPGAIPTVGEAVTIIQHPKGEDKQIALNANEVLSVWNQHVFYTTDTERGSSGSPVFNSDWKVIAIHHAGKTDEEGGIQINAKGDRKGANRGILFRDIFNFLDGKKGAGKSGGKGLESFKPEAETEVAPQPQVTTEPPASAAPPRPPVQPTSTATGIPKFVILYDVADNQHCKNLNKHLAVLKFTKKITIYNVHEGGTFGADPLEQASAEMANARLVVALITANFLASDWLGKLIEAMEAKKTVVPVLIERVDFAGTGIEKLKTLPSLNRFLSDFPNADTAYADVVEHLKRAI